MRTQRQRHETNPTARKKRFTNILRRPNFEALEARTMLDGTGLVPEIVVGRQLSTPTVTGVQNGQLRLEYTVYNQTADEISGVFLTTTLEPGVSFVDATIAPNRDGQALAWSLGTLAPYSRATVAMTVGLNPQSTVQVDGGASAHATLVAREVSDAAPPALLQNQIIDPSLLASTIDANTSDPFIQEQAARLDYDADRIFAFLRDQIGFESYAGSLRGARGTLWSHAGNALDEASLGVALLRASGIPARYAQGTLSDGLAQQLILSMFPDSFKVVGKVTDGAVLADPVNDPALLSEARSHYWIEFDTGGGFQDADTTFRDTQIGQTFTTQTGTFDEVPDALRHKVQVQLSAEIWSQASALIGFGDGLGRTEVLNHTFTTAELVGRTLSLGNVVTTAAIGAIIFSSQSTTFTPYYLLGDEALLPGQLPESHFGTAYQEVLTNFPFGTQALTGLLLNLTTTGPGQATKSYERWLMDRIGFAARTGATQTNVSIDPTGPPALTSFDAWSFKIQASTQSAPAAELARQYADHLLSAANASPDATPVTQMTAILSQAHAVLARFALGSDAETANLARGYSLAAYFSAPRIAMMWSRATQSNNQSVLSLGIDLIEDSIRAIAAPGQDVTAVRAFAGLRGMFDSYLEADVLPVPPGGVNLSSARIIEQSVQQGIPLVPIDASNLAMLQTLSIPPDAIARITAAAQAGKRVLVPARAIDVSGTPRTAWWVSDPETGEILSQGQDGGFQGWTALAVGTLIVNIIVNAVLAYYVADLQNWAAIANPILLNNAPKAALIGAVSGLIGNIFLSFVVSLAILWFLGPLGPLSQFDPAVSPGLVDLDLPYPTTPGSTADTEQQKQANASAGAVSGDVHAKNATVSGQLSASWQSEDTNGFHASSLSVPSATVLDASGNVVGTGLVTLSAPAPIPVSISGNAAYAIGGTGELSFYGGALDGLAASGKWQQFSATVSGAQAISLSTDLLKLNGTTLPAGRYTINANSATLAGSGATSAPSFSGAASLTASSGAVRLAPATGALTVGSAAVDVSQGLTFTGFNGTLTTTPGAGGTDRFALDGTAAHVLSLPGSVQPIETDQNSSPTIPVDLSTSLADDYMLSAQAPDGWVVDFDAAGALKVTPKPGVQAGEFTVRVTARSQADPTLVAQRDVFFTISPTQPGVELTIETDPIFFVAHEGGQVPSAYRALVRNLGPETETVELTFPTAPEGFEILNSKAVVTIPAGRTAIVGLYLSPTGLLPPPGTQTSFTVTATSSTDASITDSVTVPFVVPAIHGVTLRFDPTKLSTLPGVGAEANLVIEARGNVTETIDLSVDASSGLSVGGLQTVTLNPGESITLPLTLTPAAAVALNSTLMAAITANFGGNEVVRSAIEVHVAVPGVASITSAALAAAELGNADLSNRLDDLTIALTSLAQSPNDPVAKSQAIANLDSVLSLLSSDPVLANFAAPIAAGKAAIAAANDTASVQAAISQLGAALDDFGATVVTLNATNASLWMLPNTQTAQPGVASSFEVLIHNTGSETTTYDLSLAGLPASVIGELDIASITLDRDEIATFHVTITPSTTDELAPFAFQVNASPTGFPTIVKSVAGAMTARAEFVSIVSVDTEPGFADPGASVSVSARVLNAVNKEQQALAFFEVRNAQGDVVFTSQAVEVTLGIVASITEVDLGTLDTTGFELGNHTISVRLTTLAGDDIPGGSGAGSLLVGSPVTGGLTTDQTLLPPGTSVVTTTLTLESQATLVGPLGLVSQTAEPSAVGVVKFGNYAYVGASDAIRLFDVSDPAHPQLVRSFGSAANGSAATQLSVRDNKLYALQRFGPNGRFFLNIYSLTDPSDPQFLGTAMFNGQPGIPYGLAWHMVATDTHVFVSLWGFTFLQPNDIKFQIGEIIAIDVTDPTAPAFVSAMRNTYGTNNDGVGQYLNVDNSGGEGPMWEIVQADANTLLVAGSTVSGDNTQNGQGVVHSIDISDPAHMSIVNSVVIPGTVHAVGLSIEGDRAFVTGSTRGWQDQGTMNFDGDIVLAVLDISDPRDPSVLGAQTVDRASTNPADQFTASLGNGLFVFSSRNDTPTVEDPTIFVVDTNDPQNLVFSNTDIPAFTTDLAGGGNFIYTTSGSGLIIYQVDAPDAIPVTAEVRVPSNTGVAYDANSFSLAPTQIIEGADFDTLVWNVSLTAADLSRTITWNSTVTGLAPGETRDVTLGTSVEFVALGSNGAFDLAGTRVAGAQILGMTPASQTIAPGENAQFTVLVNNPTATSQTLQLALQGLTADWVSLPSSVTVPANSSANVPLVLSASGFAALADYGFTIVANGGDAGSVQGTLTLAGAPVLPIADPQAHGAVLQLLTPVVGVGAMGQAAYRLKLTNTGSVAETFRVSASNLPAGVTAGAPVEILVPPGASNFREIEIVLSLGSGVNAGSLPVSFVAQSLDSDASATADGLLAVSSLGVAVAITPGANAPGGSYSLLVTNTGSATETYQLSLAGAGALVSQLGQTQVTLAPGASTSVTVSTTVANFALPGALELVAIAEAISNTSVRAAASANITVVESKAMIATANPEQLNLAQVPGTGTFQILVQNLGNSFDEYVATILSTQGNATATLIGFDGLPTSSISGFLLPALANGALTLQVTLNGPGDGVVQVLVRSLSDSNIQSVATVHITHLGAPIATSVALVTSPTSPTQGQPIVVTAIVTPATLSGTVLGSVTFSIDGLAVTPVLVTLVNGVYQATATFEGLAPGQHLISAEYSGGGGYSGAGATTVLDVQSQLVAPRIVSVQRFGFHARPTTLAITFDQALDEVSATNLASYKLVGAGGRIRIRSVSYDAVSNTVLVRPAQRLALGRNYKLTVSGSDDAPIKNIGGAVLDGDGDGLAGGAYVTRISRATFERFVAPGQFASNSLAARILGAFMPGAEATKAKRKGPKARARG